MGRRPSRAALAAAAAFQAPLDDPPSRMRPGGEAGARLSSGSDTEETTPEGCAIQRYDREGVL